MEREKLERLVDLFCSWRAFFKVFFLSLLEREERRVGEREKEEHQCERETSIGCFLVSTQTRD